MIYTYDFQIAGLLIRVNSPFALAEMFELFAFQVSSNPDRPPDALYSIELLPEEWNIRGTMLSQRDHTAVYKWQGQLHHYYFWNIYSQERYVLVVTPSAHSTKHTIYLQKDKLDQVLSQFRLSAFLSPERLFLNKEAFFLHASLIDWQGQGILFSAPSGIGKSTQAALWAQLEGAEILNGDKAIIRHQDGQFLAYGSPYAGTSGIYKNRCVPIRAIVMLAQAKENILQRLSPANALRKILPESIVLPWDPQFMNNVTELLLNVVNEIPVYHLSCLPDSSAVDILKQTLTT